MEANQLNGREEVHNAFAGGAVGPLHLAGKRSNKRVMIDYMARYGASAPSGERVGACGRAANENIADVSVSDVPKTICIIE